MPKLNDAGDVFKGTVRADRVYAGTVLVWPTVETWSAWVMIGTAVTAAPSAWFAGGLTNYDTGTHEMGRFRYSNLGRVHYRGLLRCTVDTPAGTAVIGCNITDPNVPKPSTVSRMGSGPASPAYSPIYGGGYARFDASTDTYHHKVSVATQTAVTIPASNWFAMDVIFAFAADA